MKITMAHLLERNIYQNPYVTKSEFTSHVPHVLTHRVTKQHTFEVSEKKNLTKILDSRLGCVQEKIKTEEEKELDIDSDHDTPLHIFLAKSSAEGDSKDFDINFTVDLILSKQSYFRPYANIPDKYQQTPLHIAVFLRSIPLVTALLHIGADWCHFDCRLETPLHAAVSFANERKGHSESTNQIESDIFSSNQDEAYLSFPYSAVGTVGESPIKRSSIFSANQNNGSMFLTNQDNDSMFTIIKLLLESSGAQKLDYVDALNEKGESPLHMAVDKERYDIARILIEHGANKNVQESKSGYTPLMLLIRKMIHTNQEIVKRRRMLVIKDFLREFKPDVNLPSYSKDTALHLACSGNSAEIVSALLDADAKVNERNSSRKSEKDLTTSKQIKVLLEKRLRKKRRHRMSRKEDDKDIKKNIPFNEELVFH